MNSNLPEGFCQENLSKKIKFPLSLLKSSFNKFVESFRSKKEAYWAMRIKRTRCSVDNELSSEVKDDPFKFINSLSETKRRLLCLMFSCDRYNTRNMKLDQTWLSKQLGCTREWVCKLIKSLCQLGILAKVNLGYSDCVYRVNSFFRKKKTRSLLVLLLPPIIFIRTDANDTLFKSEMEIVHTYKRKEIIKKKDILRNEYKAKPLEAYYYKSEDEQRIKEQQTIIANRFDRINKQKKEKRLSFLEKCNKNKEMGLALLSEAGVTSHKSLPFFRVPEEIIENIRRSIGGTKTFVRSQPRPVSPSPKISQQKGKSKVDPINVKPPQSVAKEDIPEAKMLEIRKYPADVQKKLIESVLMGMRIKQRILV